VTTGEITGLRTYVRGLKEATAVHEGLLSAMRRYTAQFQESYGIDVRVECETDININDRLAAELIQIVHEGLSNVRKHTNSTSGRICLESCGKKIILSVENDDEGGEPTGPFVPRSITERAGALGGQTRVECNAERTSVRVEIPL
jgi:signal transduction histidine kinase